MIAEIKPQIESTLKDQMTVDHLEVLNESGNHNVPKGSQTHFKVVIVSSDFVGLPLVKRHQKIYGLLESFLKNGVHALALHTYTPDEWTTKYPASPLCRG